MSKTVSMPLDLIDAVLDEAEVMNKEFSGAVQTLLRIGINVRRDARIREEEETKKAISRMV